MSNLTDYAYDLRPYPGNSDDDPDPGSFSFKTIKRGTRACDRCRKLKSKCEPTTGDKCKNCAAANISCTFQGPSFKRGPPKGYIHAIEQRWHQVECILATIMVTPQAQDIISELRSDPFSRAILDRVESGPYGPGAREHQSQTSKSENFYATIMGAPDANARDDRRVRRQSRLTREIVSIEDSNMFATPTKEWQEQLMRRLAGGRVSEYHSVTPVYRNASPASYSSSSRHQESVSPNLGPERQRRKLETTYVPDQSVLHSDRGEEISDEPYSTLDEVDDTTDSFGHLALDDHKEIRYHGHASGLPLLARSEHKDGGRKPDALWNFPELKQEALSEDFHSNDAEDATEIPLPPMETQQHLINLYFTYVHPFFPVIHKQYFMSDFSTSQSMDSQHCAGRPAAITKRMQKMNKLLLLAMFSIAARFWDNKLPGSQSEDMLNEGVSYAMRARQILNNIYQFSQPSTVQALLLLGIREFGIGSMEQGWLYSGMALRMAIDLGMNRNADKWTSNGRELFTPVEKQRRKQIWWSCCMTDKLSAMWMGRPIMFRANDYSTLIPDLNDSEEYEVWQPYPPDALGHDFSPKPAKLMSCFQKQCELSVIITDIMDRIYPVRPSSDTPRRTLLQQLEARLHNWLFGLPDSFRYSTTSSLHTPSPHVLVLHMEYCSAVLLLHRAFIPSPRSHPTNEGSLQVDPIPLKSFDICQSAASHISSIVTVYHEKYGLNSAPAFVSIYLQTAGIMHIITLTRQPRNTQATIGLRQCTEALEHMQRVWPSASRVRNLLEGAQVKQDQTSLSIQDNALRRKRSMGEAMGSEKNSVDIDRMPSGGVYSESEFSYPGPTYDEDASARLMYHTLGLDTGVDDSISYPGYQWWPSDATFDENFMQDNLADASSIAHASVNGVNMPAGAFTFDQNHFTPDFIQGVHYPILDTSHLFASHSHTTYNPDSRHPN
ncbi:uncharacterized protein FIBRA_06626 [Fibroporia radiculosa]|uniref:Zn(2)-C6 fungal-type domain-containing protein n=1 Tax=Fibroporia radiculosa TaxID=599839 RepID=J4IBD0_9APHY|nr:uncharacterized protein FIBRA_06626 [Fibroporia radiculosa]CCM04446.1 predicted protein [Fibroporia radiculosa]